MKAGSFSAFALAFALVLLAGCGESAKVETGPVALRAAGATFPAPVYEKWFELFKTTGKEDMRRDAIITYEAVGSGEGIARLKAGTVDFAASDMPLTDSELAALGKKVLHFPMMIGAVVPVYNVPGITKPLNFTGEILAGIYSGKIGYWNDPDLVEANPRVNLPARPIIAVHRAEGSGTTYVFTNYLCKVSPEWKKSFGEGFTVKFPGGREAKGNEGVADLVKNTPYALGYVELSFAMQRKEVWGAVKNAAGAYQKADLQSITTAADGFRDIPADLRLSITNAPNAGAYPITSYTFLIVPAEISDGAKRGSIKAFIRWAIEKGQNEAMSLEYATLPQSVAEAAKKLINEIKAPPAA
jgi:phosphate transport system substrate-binding protein